MKKRMPENNSTSSTKSILLASTIILAIIIAFTIVYTEYFFDPCDTTVHQRVLSPDKKRYIVVFSKDCGATTGFNTQASLVNSGARFGPNVGKRFLSISGQHDLSITWHDEENVTVKLISQEKLDKDENKLYLMDNKYGDVIIRYDFYSLYC